MNQFAALRIAMRWSMSRRAESLIEQYERALVTRMCARLLAKAAQSIKQRGTLPFDVVVTRAGNAAASSGPICGQPTSGRHGRTYSNALTFVEQMIYQPKCQGSSAISL